MPLNLLIVTDKFKGTLTAQAAADLIARGWREARPQDSLELLPMSDGGDGFGEVLVRLLKLEERTIATMDAAHTPLQAKWWWDPKTRTAIIESAGIIGLALLPTKKFHPFDLDTFGLGAALQAAADMGARHCLMGIGDFIGMRWGLWEGKRPSDATFADIMSFMEHGIAAHAASEG